MRKGGIEMERTVTLKNVQVTETELRDALAKLDKPSVIDGIVHHTRHSAVYRISPNDDESFRFCTPYNCADTAEGCYFKKEDAAELIAALQAAQKEMGWV